MYQIKETGFKNRNYFGTVIKDEESNRNETDSNRADFSIQIGDSDIFARITHWRGRVLYLYELKYYFSIRLKFMCFIYKYIYIYIYACVYIDRFIL